MNSCASPSRANAKAVSSGIADFFAPKPSGKMDVLGLSLVTIGPKASVETQRLFEAGEYTRYLYLHGLSVETAEALAEYHHKKMREELGIAGDDSPHVRDLFHQKYRGSRYSFGYPACPHLEDQTKLFALLHPEENVGVRLTSGFLLEPEQYLGHRGAPSGGKVFCGLRCLGMTVRRMKTYTGEQGYVYQYYFVGKRPALPEQSTVPAVEYVFDVTSDRKSTYSVSVFVPQAVLEGWASGHGRKLTEAEEYGAVKMRLFRAFDEIEDIRGEGRILRLEGDVLDQVLARLGVA